MALINEIKKRILALTPQAGVFNTKIENLSCVRADQTMDSPAPIVYEPCIYLVVQGQKIAYLGSEVYQYDSLNYLVLSVPLPLECQIIEASTQHPYLAVKIDINRQMLSELMQTYQTHQAPFRKEKISKRGVFVSKINSDISHTLFRILSYLNDPAASSVLAPLAIKELLFHILQGEQGDQLKAFAYRDKNNFRIAQTINFIQNNYASTIEVSELASKANMSPSSFHQYFKAITNSSPIQYIKTIRLHHARRKILFENHNASDAAYYVGYASPSQFSREYRRLFGLPPSEERQSLDEVTE